MISKFEGKSVCLNGSLFYHENLFVIILTNFARFERTFLFVLVINNLNFSIFKKKISTSSELLSNNSLFEGQL